MLFSAAVLGVQKLLIEISGWFWFSTVLAGVLLFWLMTLWWPDVFAARTQRVALALFGILLIARFLVPVAAMANEAVFDLFLAPGYAVANARLEDATKELGSADEVTSSKGSETVPDDSLRGKLEGFFESAKNKADVKAKIDDLKIAANNTAQEMIALIALFMIQTLVLPLLFAWLGYLAARSLARYALATTATTRSDSDH